jgi:hypothetical protein
MLLRGLPTHDLAIVRPSIRSASRSLRMDLAESLPASLHALCAFLAHFRCGGQRKHVSPLARPAATAWVPSGGRAGSSPASFQPALRAASVADDAALRGKLSRDKRGAAAMGLSPRAPTAASRSDRRRPTDQAAEIGARGPWPLAGRVVTETRDHTLRLTLPLIREQGN